LYFSSPYLKSSRPAQEYPRLRTVNARQRIAWRFALKLTNVHFVLFTPCLVRLLQPCLSRGGGYFW